MDTKEVIMNAKDFTIRTPFEEKMLQAAFRFKNSEIKLLRVTCVLEGLYIVKQAHDISKLELKAAELLKKNEG